MRFRRFKALPSDSVHIWSFDLYNDIFDFNVTRAGLTKSGKHHRIHSSNLDLLLGLQSIKTNQIIILDVFPVKKTLHVIFLQIFLLSSEEMRVKIVKNAVYLWSMLQIMIVHRLLRNICKS